MDERIENVEERTGRPSLVNDGLVHDVEEKLNENRKSSMASLSMDFL